MKAGSGETNDINSFCETVASTMVEVNGIYRSIHDDKGFKILIKTRKAILSRIGTYSPHGLTTFTNAQKDNKEAIKMEQADVVLACVNTSRDNPIPGAISTMLNVMFDSVSTTYRSSFYIPVRDKLYSKFKTPLVEWLDFDVPNTVTRGLYEMVKNVLENGYIPFDYDEF